MANDQINTPALPPGFEIESAGVPPLPDGFEFIPPDNSVIVRPPIANASPDSTAADIVKSAGSGVTKGLTGAIGQFGDAGDLSAHIHEWLARRIFGDEAGDWVRQQFIQRANAPSGAELAARMYDPKAAERIHELTAGSAQTPFGPAPTSGELTQGLETITGPLHQPQSIPGKYAQTFGEIGPLAAVAGPEGALANTLKLGVAPAIASEAAGQAVEGSPFEGPARVAGGLLGGTVGIGAGRGVEALQNYGAAREAAQDIGNVSPGAVSRMGKSFEADKLTPEIVREKAAQLGPEAMMLDMGRQMQGRAEAIASQPGEGQNTILNAVEQRVHGTDQFGNVQSAFGQETANRIKQTLDAQLGVAHNKVDLLNGVSQIVDNQARPLYESVMAKYPVVNLPADITSRPAIAQAMKDATSLAKNYGEKLTGPAETKTILSGPGYHIAEDVTPQAQPSLRYWDYVKKSLDSRINGLMRNGGMETLDSADKADLGGLIDARNALRNNLDQQTNGEYALARRAAAFKPQLNEAYETGRAAFNNNLLPEEFSDQLSNMSGPEEVMAKAGFRRELERTIDVARNDGAAARRMLDTNSNLDKVENLFGPDARQAVENRIAAETRYQTAAQNIAGNSRTAVRTQTAKDTESPSAATPPQANLTGFLYKGAGQGLNYLRNQGVEGTRADIGKMSTARGNNLTTLADVLSRYNERRAANAGAPIGSQVSTLGRLLMLNPSVNPLLATPQQVQQP